MSLYKTQRCRHFDEAGNPIKPYCSQGSKCRFIHPNDHQWSKLRRRVDDSPSPENRETARSAGRNRPQFSPSNPPLQRQRSSPLIPQTDLFKHKQKDNPREHDRCDWSVRDGDRRRDSDSWGYARERNGPLEQGCSLKRPSDQGDSYPNQRPRLSERTLRESVPRSDIRHATQTDKTTRPAPHASARPKATSKLSDTFHRLAKLCCEIVRDTCFLDREEDKLKAFTGLSSELSRAVPDAAVAVTPALATVITGHTRTRERLENHMEELETLWKALFSVIEGDIAKIIDSRLEQAMTLLGNERDNALQSIRRSQRVVGGGVHDGTTRLRQSTDGWGETGTGRTTTSERGTAPPNMSPEETRHYGGPASLSLVPTQEMDLGTSLRIMLEDMRAQMDRQTRAMELLAKENSQLKSATGGVPSQLVSPDSVSSSPRKPPLL